MVIGLQRTIKSSRVPLDTTASNQAPKCIRELILVATRSTPKSAGWKFTSGPILEKSHLSASLKDAANHSPKREILRLISALIQERSLTLAALKVVEEDLPRRDISTTTLEVTATWNPSRADFVRRPSCERALWKRIWEITLEKDRSDARIDREISKRQGLFARIWKHTPKMLLLNNQLKKLRFLNIMNWLQTIAAYRRCFQKTWANQLRFKMLLQTSRQRPPFLLKRPLRATVTALTKICYET